MTKEQSDCFILGTTQKGNKFRPSDWIERIASVFASYDNGQRLRYSNTVRPSVYEGLRCLFVAGSLAMLDPAAYDFVMEFASSNHLQIVEIVQAVAEQPPAIDLQDVA